MLCLYHCEPLSRRIERETSGVTYRKEISAADKSLDHRSCILNLIISFDKHQSKFVITLVACMFI